MKIKGYIKRDGMGHVIEITQGIEKIQKKYLQDSEKIYDIEIKEENKRTLPQNSYYWGVVIKIISEHVGEDPLSLHEIFKNTFLGFDLEDGLSKGKSTRDISKERFVKYINDIKEWAFNWLNIVIPEAKEYF